MHPRSTREPIQCNPHIAKKADLRTLDTLLGGSCPARAARSTVVSTTLVATACPLQTLEKICTKTTRAAGFGGATRCKRALPPAAVCATILRWTS